MTNYIIRRIINMIPTLILISITTFIIIELPPGDWLTNQIARLEAQGEVVGLNEIEFLRQRYGLDKPLYQRYFIWLWNFLQGDFGRSFGWDRPVGAILAERIPLTAVMALATWLFTTVVSFFVGFYVATHQYSVGDYAATFIGFIGLSIPNFFLALILMWFVFSVFGQSVGGLFSPGMIDEPWSWAKFIDFLNHLWLPVVVIGTAGTAGSIRTFRANLLDELSKPYVDAARAKGLTERKVLFKYPLRIALIPWASTIGWMLPGLISGGLIVAVVLNLPTTGPVLLGALRTQDMYLAGSFIMFISILTVIGTLISDILLAVVDPRIRFR